jgi:hypothetical protein
MNKSEIVVVKKGTGNLPQQITCNVVLPMTYNIIVNGVGVFSPNAFPEDDDSYDLSNDVDSC